MKNLILVLLVFSSSLYAQKGDMREKMKKVKAMKIAHITSELSLSADEAAKFWPVYNEFEDRERKLRRDRIALTRKNSADVAQSDEKKAGEILSQLEQNDDELCRERKKFNAQLRQILPASKILKLSAAEDDFNRRLLRQYKSKGGKK